MCNGEQKQGFGIVFKLATVTTILVLAGSVPAMAAPCEIPLFVKQGLSGANVMILADNSGSMNAAMYDSRYNPNTVYSGNFSTNSTYFISSDD